MGKPGCSLILFYSEKYDTGAIKYRILPLIRLGNALNEIFFFFFNKSLQVAFCFEINFRAFLTSDMPFDKCPFN